MATREPRINIALDRESHEILKLLAKKTSKSVSMLCAEFIRKQIEWDEDAYDLQYIQGLCDVDLSQTYSDEEVQRKLDALSD